jgi:hypothetical protein
MVWNCDPVVRRLRRFQDDMAADLMHPRVIPFPAQKVSENRAGNVAR